MSDINSTSSDYPYCMPDTGTDAEYGEGSTSIIWIEPGQPKRLRMLVIDIIFQVYKQEWFELSGM